MQIAKRYLDEIEQICNFYVEDENCLKTEMEIDKRDEPTLYDILHRHWNYPTLYAGLFVRCQPQGSDVDFDKCGCLTQLRWGKKPYLGAHIMLDNLTPLIELTDELRGDERIATCVDDILPEELKQVLYPLTDADREAVKKILYPYAEWQTRLRLQFKDVPANELKLQEIENNVGQ